MSSCTENTKASCQMQKNVNVLQEIDIFAKVAPHVLKVIALLCRKIDLVEGEILFNKGDDPAQAIYVMSGSFRLNYMTEQSHSIKSGDMVGSLNLCCPFPSLFSMTAEEKSEVLILDRESFDKVVEQFPEVLPLIVKASISRVHEWDKKQCKAESLNRPYGGVSLL